jgi:hypothetical protein
MIEFQGEQLTERISKGLTREWRHQNRLVILTISDIHIETLQKYFATGREVVHDYPRDQILYMMNDCSHPNVSLTPYFREQLNDLVAFLKLEDKTMYVAVVLPNTLFFRIFVLFLNVFNSRVKDVKITQKPFISRDEGLAWLESLVQKEDQTNL